MEPLWRGLLGPPGNCPRHELLSTTDSGHENKKDVYRTFHRAQEVLTNKEMGRWVSRQREIRYQVTLIPFSCLSY